MNCNLNKLMSLFLVISLIVCSLAGISVITSNAHVADLAPSGITTYNLDVGDTKYIFLGESDKAIQSAVWTSNAPFDVEILSQDSGYCQIKVNNYISTTAIITCEYYYQQLNSLTGQIWLIKGAKSFYVKVSEDSQTVTPTNPTEPDTPDNTSKTYVYDRGTLGIYKYIIKADGTAEITNYEYKLETSITIPSAINGYAVASIGENAFEYCGKLKGITIPEGVTDIKDKAFYFCYKVEGNENLTDVNAMYIDGYMVLNSDSLGIYALTVPGAPAPAYELGDANTDGHVNIKDATAIQKHIAGIELLSAEGLKVADYNSDESINIKDATAIQKFIAGIV